MNNKLKIIKYKAILFFIGLIFLSASFIIIYINFRFNDDNIIKVNANVESIEYYEYGIIKKQKFANVIYSFIYEGKEIMLTNSYLENSDNNISVNSTTEILYDRISNTIVTKPSIYTLIIAFIFIIFAIVVIVFAFKLKQNNIYVSPKL
ncbi:hypothetical protein [Brachyspira hampsonii]|uniref:DUF3592 domain-containing protein n=1 Tax=Brachyspira hampsonii 30446 TaxID=1289135 RepID=A0A2U4FFG2_9SPIR|nr:hypothetical protein [Brachyspira hampsonii]EKV55901.1 hypothetical protein A966_13660 [Brachyspira hampsonii 30446]MBW5390213.1 hypothetical protein [Brachyspira hampsonii]MBW5394611.1 hypothetical protein [Brachyspira hampsonii]OEJ20358.1 hypothetical protein A9495_12355 [Brachyspira hampsonii]